MLISEFMEVDNEINEKQPKIGTFWWIRQVLLVLVGCFYLYFGIHLLVSAYRLNDPSTFILTFFASNFIILISAALLIGFIYRMVVVYRHSKNINT